MIGTIIGGFMDGVGLANDYGAGRDAEIKM